jgi:hypothetical protein
MLERALCICQHLDLSVWFLRVASALGEAYILSGRVADAIPVLTQAMEWTTATNMVGYQVLCRLPLDEALALARTHQERGHQAYALRLLSDIAA